MKELKKIENAHAAMLHDLRAELKSIGVAHTDFTPDWDKKLDRAVWYADNTRGQETQRLNELVKAHFDRPDYINPYPPQKGCVTRLAMDLVTKICAGRHYDDSRRDAKMSIIAGYRWQSMIAARLLHFWLEKVEHEGLRREAALGVAMALIQSSGLDQKFTTEAAMFVLDVTDEFFTGYYSWQGELECKWEGEPLRQSIIDLMLHPPRYRAERLMWQAQLVDIYKDHVRFADLHARALDPLHAYK